MADRYTGRHIRRARRQAWMDKTRSPSNPLLPAAAALTVAGLLVGSVGVLQLSVSQHGAQADMVADYDPADYPPVDRDAQAHQIGLDESQTMAEASGGPAGAPTQASSKTNQPPGNSLVISTGTCNASYDDKPQATANGEVFDPDALSAAHKSLPFNSRVRVTNVSNGTSVIVRINDRGPTIVGRCLNLSRAAFNAIASLHLGVLNVRYEVLAIGTT